MTIRAIGFFGSRMPGRRYESRDDRFGFQGQETDDEIKGEGNSIFYKYRVHDPRLGRFLSVDPLTADFPWNSPYAFSENRVIDGIELEGAEFLDVDQSMYHFIAGDVHLTIENLSNPSFNAFNAANSNPVNWPAGSVGIDTRIGQFSIPDLPLRPYDPKLNQVGWPETPANSSADQVLRANSGNGVVAQSTGRLDQRYSVNQTVSRGMARARGGAGLMLAVNLLNAGTERLINRMMWNDHQKMKDQINTLSIVGNIVIDALDRGVIPEEYQNMEHVSQIMNVVLFGDQDVDDEIYELGMEIYNSAVRDRIVTYTMESGMDNHPVEHRVEEKP